MANDLVQSLSSIIKQYIISNTPPAVAEESENDTNGAAADGKSQLLQNVVNNVEQSLLTAFADQFPDYQFQISVNAQPLDPGRDDDSGIHESLSTPNDATTSGISKKPVRAYVDGCFDLMHSGHYNAIRQAKQLCDVLVVGVHSDDEILHHKGPTVMNNEERLSTVRACKWADEVVFDTPYNPTLELLDQLNCDFCIHGDDIPTTADGVDAYAETKQAGRMKIIKRTEGISTTDLVGRLLLMTRNHHLAVDPTPRNSPPMTTRRLRSVSGADSIRGAGAYSPIPTTKLSKRQSTGDSSVTSITPSRSASPVASAGGSASFFSNSTSPAPPHKSINMTVLTAAAGSNAAPNGSTQEWAQARGISNFLPTTWRISQFSNSRVPTKDDVVIYIDGAFDLFHIGHIETLKRAKELGTFLYVGMHDDATVNKIKGHNFPIMNLHERVLNVLSCKYVDEVIIGAPWKITADMIKTLNINYVVSGSATKFPVDVLSSTTRPASDCAAAPSTAAPLDPTDPYYEAKKAGIFREIDSTKFLSTSQVIERIIENRLKFEKRNTKRSAKEVDYLTQKKEREYISEI